MHPHARGEVGAARTPAQIQYACECITWTFQDRYAVVDLYRLGKADPKAVQDVTVEISAECKRRRPAALGPDPNTAQPVQASSAAATR